MFLIFLGFLYIVQLCVFTFLVPCCDVHNDFHKTTMFCSSLPLVVCRRTYYVFVYICLRKLMSNILLLIIVLVFCVVLCCVLFVLVLCLVYQMLFLWIVHSWLPLRFSLTFIVFLVYVCVYGFQHFAVAHLLSFLLYFSSSCVLCIQCCQFLWIVHSWLPHRFSLTFI